MREVPFADPDVDEAPAFISDDSPDDAGERLLRLPADTEDGFVLPSTGTGVRASRRRQQRRYIWRRHARVVTAAFVAVLVIAVLLVVAHPWKGGGGSDTKKAPPTVLPATLPSSAVL